MGASNPDPAGYPVDFLDPVLVRIRPDPNFQDPISLGPHHGPAQNFGRWLQEFWNRIRILLGRIRENEKK